MNPKMNYPKRNYNETYNVVQLIGGHCWEYSYMFFRGSLIIFN